MLLARSEEERIWPDDEIGCLLLTYKRHIHGGNLKIYHCYRTESACFVCVLTSFVFARGGVLETFTIDKKSMSPLDQEIYGNLVLSFQQKPPLKIASNGNFWRFSRSAVVCLFALVMAFQMPPRVFGTVSKSFFSSDLVRNLCKDTTHPPDDACLNQKACLWISSTGSPMFTILVKPWISWGMQSITFTRLWTEGKRRVWMCSNWWLTLSRYFGEIMVFFGIWPIPSNKTLSTAMQRRCFMFKCLRKVYGTLQ